MPYLYQCIFNGCFSILIKDGTAKMQYFAFTSGLNKVCFQRSAGPVKWPQNISSCGLFSDIRFTIPFYFSKGANTECKKRRSVNKFSAFHFEVSFDECQKDNGLYEYEYIFHLQMI